MHLPRIVPPVLDSFTDQDSRVRYYACEVASLQAPLPQRATQVPSVPTNAPVPLSVFPVCRCRIHRPM